MKWVAFNQCLLWISPRRYGRRLLVLALLLVGVFIFNLALISYRLEWRLLHEGDSRRGDEGRKIHDEQLRCSADPLAESALRRMRSAECRSRLADLLCQLEGNWPSAQINNACRSQFDRSALYHPKGCYADSNTTRLLADYKYTLKENSVKACVQACLRAGFRFAGVENGTECFCGNSEEFGNHPEKEERCLESECPSSSAIIDTTLPRHCGGRDAIAVYSTGVMGTDRKLPHFAPPPHDLEKNGPKSRRRSLVKILFLLQLNGRNSRQVSRMIKAIYSPHHLYYVHVDASQHYMFNEMKKLEELFRSSGQSNFQVAEERFQTSWGATALLDMFLNVITTTTRRSSDPAWSNWDYILNLSEVDMPVLSLEELEENLLTNMGKSFLSSHGYNTGRFIRKQGYNYHFLTCERRTWRIAVRKHYTENLRLDGGSDWVVVHRDLAEYAISLDDVDPLPLQLRNFFSTVLLPLESFFHTLALNSRFCERVVYKNLRLTNWNRRQGCRCEALKRVVDWCGCSPLAVRASDQHKMVIEESQARLHFFGRKFDSLVDVRSVALAERQALRFRPKLLADSKHPSFNATWLNTYHSAGSGDCNVGDKYLLRAWAESLFNSSRRHHHSGKNSGCKFAELEAVNVYKEKPISASPAMVLTVRDGCGIVHELLTLTLPSLQLNAIEIIFGVDGSNYAIQSMEFGQELDLKEEVFRNYPPVIDTEGSLTLLWSWKSTSPPTKQSNFTSPPVRLRLHSPRRKVVLDTVVKAYDSVNGAQHYTVQFKLLDAGEPGEWLAELLSPGINTTATSIKFPVFSPPSGGDSSQLNELTNKHYQVVDVCVVDDEMSTATCSRRKWSTKFPDLKSQLTPSWVNMVLDESL